MTRRPLLMGKRIISIFFYDFLQDLGRRVWREGGTKRKETNYDELYTSVATCRRNKCKPLSSCCFDFVVRLLRNRSFVFVSSSKNTSCLFHFTHISAMLTRTSPIIRQQEHIQQIQRRNCCRFKKVWCTNLSRRARVWENVSIMWTMCICVISICCYTCKTYRETFKAGSGWRFL